MVETLLNSNQASDENSIELPTKPKQHPLSQSLHQLKIALSKSKDKAIKSNLFVRINHQSNPNFHTTSPLNQERSTQNKTPKDNRKKNPTFSMSEIQNISINTIFQAETETTQQKNKKERKLTESTQLQIEKPPNIRNSKTQLKKTSNTQIRTISR